MNREGGRAALTALDAAIPALRAGDLVGVYPEGTRSPDGRLYRGRTGAARLALLAEVPIIPVGIIGTEKVQPIGSAVPKLRPRRSPSGSASRWTLPAGPWTAPACAPSPTS